MWSKLNSYFVRIIPCLWSDISTKRVYNSFLKKSNICYICYYCYLFPILLLFISYSVVGCVWRDCLYWYLLPLGHTLYLSTYHIIFFFFSAQAINSMFWLLPESSWIKNWSNFGLRHTWVWDFSLELEGIFCGKAFLSNPSLIPKQEFAKCGCWLISWVHERWSVSFLK